MITPVDYKEQIAIRRAEAKSRAFDRVLNDLKVGLMAFVAVIIGLGAFLWHIAWYHSILFTVLSFWMLYLYVRGLFKTMDVMMRLHEKGSMNPDK